MLNSFLIVPSISAARESWNTVSQSCGGKKDGRSYNSKKLLPNLNLKIHFDLPIDGQPQNHLFLYVVSGFKFFLAQSIFAAVPEVDTGGNFSATILPIQYPLN